jgi:hypothetical protein
MYLQNHMYVNNIITTTTLTNNSMEEDRSWEADSRFASQKIPRLFCNPEISSPYS